MTKFQKTKANNIDSVIKYNFGAAEMYASLENEDHSHMLWFDSWFSQLEIRELEDLRELIRMFQDVEKEWIGDN